MTLRNKLTLFGIYQYRPDIKFEQIKFLFNREFACFVPSYLGNTPMARKSTRHFRCHSVQHLDFILKAILHWQDYGTLYNLYYSMATYRTGLPRLTGNLKDRRPAVELWKDAHWKFMEAYDWLIDIDAHDHEQIEVAFESAKEIKKLFDKVELPYELRFSGCGFHFIVPYSAFSHLPFHFNPHEEGNVFDFLTDLGEILHERVSELIDWKIPDSRRVCKLPYSIAYYENSQYLCCPILSDEEFKKFKLENYRLSNFVDVQGRGTHLFNAPGKNINYLMKEMNVVINNGKNNS